MFFRVSCILSFIRSGLGFGSLYSFLVAVILFFFLITRIPYIFGVFGFLVFLFSSISPLFLSLFFTRLSNHGLTYFFCSFVPPGTPLWISPLVALAESVSYLVRPFVLLLRPFLNISLGSFGGMIMGSIFFSNFYVLLFLVLLFFYEIFVALVHWFIVCSILSFSKDH